METQCNVAPAVADPQIKVGTVLHGSWGYDQTNPEFYVVTRRTAKSVWMKPLGYKMVWSEGYSSMAGNCVANEAPAADAKEYGPVRVRNGHCNEPKYGHCTLRMWSGTPEYVSWYA